MGLFGRKKVQEAKPYSFETPTAKADEKRRIAVSQQRLDGQQAIAERGRLAYEKDLQATEAIRNRINHTSQ